MIRESVCDYVLNPDTRPAGYSDIEMSWSLGPPVVSAVSTDLRRCLVVMNVRVNLILALGVGKVRVDNSRLTCPPVLRCHRFPHEVIHGEGSSALVEAPALFLEDRQEPPSLVPTNDVSERAAEKAPLVEGLEANGVFIPTPAIHCHGPFLQRLWLRPGVVAKVEDTFDPLAHHVMEEA